MSHFIKIYTVCKFNIFCLWYLNLDLVESLIPFFHVNVSAGVHTGTSTQISDSIMEDLLRAVELIFRYVKI